MKPLLHHEADEEFAVEIVDGVFLELGSDGGEVVVLDCQLVEGDDAELGFAGLEDADDLGLLRL